MSLVVAAAVEPVSPEVRIVGLVSQHVPDGDELVSLRGRVRTRAGEDVVAALLAAGALEEEAPRARPSDRRLTAVQMVAQAFAPRPERIVVDRAGHRWPAPALASSGTTAVTSVLEAAIAEIDAQSRRLVCGERMAGKA